MVLTAITQPFLKLEAWNFHQKFFKNIFKINFDFFSQKIPPPHFFITLSIFKLEAQMYTKNSLKINFDFFPKNYCANIVNFSHIAGQLHFAKLSCIVKFFEDKIRTPLSLLPHFMLWSTVQILKWLQLSHFMKNQQRYRKLLTNST